MRLREALTALGVTARALSQAEKDKLDRDGYLPLPNILSAEKIAPMVAFLAADASAEVTNQVFGVRKNEIFLFSKPRPIRSMHRSEGWSAETIASDLLPAFRPSFYGNDRSGDIFPWDPI